MFHNPEKIRLSTVIGSYQCWLTGTSRVSVSNNSRSRRVPDTGHITAGHQVGLDLDEIEQQFLPDRSGRNSGTVPVGDNQPGGGFHRLEDNAVVARIGRLVAEFLGRAMHPRHVHRQMRNFPGVRNPDRDIVDLPPVKIRPIAGVYPDRIIPPRLQIPDLLRNLVGLGGVPSGRRKSVTDANPSVPPLHIQPVPFKFRRRDTAGRGRVDRPPLQPLVEVGVLDMGQRVRIIGQPLTTAFNRVVTEQPGTPPQVCLLYTSPSPRD